MLPPMRSIGSRDRIYPIKNKSHKPLSPKILEQMQFIQLKENHIYQFNETRRQCPKWVKGIVNFFTKHHVK